MPACLCRAQIVAGLMTIVQSSGIKHPRLPFQWGAGTLSVMGISFTTMPIAQAVVPQLKRVYATAHSCGLKVRGTHGSMECAATFACIAPVSALADALHGAPAPQYDYFAFGSSAGGSPCNVINNPDAAVGVGAFGGFGPPCIPYCVNEAFDYAWGKLLGTLAFCALIPMFISFMPARRINNLFPPVVIGPVIMLIGISLVGVGFGDWGGGTFCAQRVIHNGFSNNLFSAVVTNDGVEGFTSTDGVTSPKQGSGMHQITLNYDDFGAMYIDGQLLNTSQHFTNAVRVHAMPARNNAACAALVSLRALSCSCMLLATHTKDDHGAQQRATDRQPRRLRNWLCDHGLRLLHTFQLQWRRPGVRRVWLRRVCGPWFLDLCDEYV
jgi:hypothetical protein